MQQSGISVGVEGIDRADERADAFRRFADSRLSASYRLARLILRDSTEAEDAVHDAFVTAWTKWSTLRDPDKLQPWFDRIVVNKCRNRLRARSRWVTQSEIRDLPMPSDDPMATVDDRQLVGAAFARLGADDRIVLALRFYRDLQVDDIAVLTDVRPGTVKSRLHRALARLRVIMEEDGTVGPDR